MSKKDQIGDAPVQVEYREKMNILAGLLDDCFNGPPSVATKKTTGFILMVFPFEGRKGRVNYISNTEREDVIVLLKKQLAYFEGQSQNLKGNA